MSLEYMYLISLDASATQLQGGSWVQFGPVRSSQVPIHSEFQTTVAVLVR
jgi:uncharacterized protein YaiE (UPF0345 family)